MTADPFLIRLPLEVRFSDCDPLGHVNNAVYLTYIEQARIVMWRHQIGTWPRAFADGGPKGQGFILARAEVDFRSQAREGDQLEVRLALEGFGRTSLTYRYEIVNVSTGRLVVAAKTVQVWLDYDAEKPIPFPEDVKANLVVPVDLGAAG
jgi:acyl-CoA thioester hydrolase